MVKRFTVAGALASILASVVVFAALGAQPEMYVSSDPGGQSRVLSVHEGEQVFVALYDPHENLDNGTRERIWKDIRVTDPSTGSCLVAWQSCGEGDDCSSSDPTYVPYRGHYPGNPGSMAHDYLEETTNDSGLFVSSRSFQIPLSVSVAELTLSSQVSWTDFVDGTGNVVTRVESLAAPLYVRVTDPSQAGSRELTDAVWVGTRRLPLVSLDGAPAGTFVTPAFTMSEFGSTDPIEAKYVDPGDPLDYSFSGTVSVSRLSILAFVDSSGTMVTSYLDSDLVYVKVTDPSWTGAARLAGAMTIGAVAYDLAPLSGAAIDTFITTGLDLNLAAGATVTATYKDPTDPTDTSSCTITVIASKLVIESFYAGPNPLGGWGPVTFGYKGTGIAVVMRVQVFSLPLGTLVWSREEATVSQIVWDGKTSDGAYAINGWYIYIVEASDGTNTFEGRGTLFINR